jgi:23S rRNA-/tRNA-specific pseudouridylate synthase
MSDSELLKLPEILYQSERLVGVTKPPGISSTLIPRLGPDQVMTVESFLQATLGPEVRLLHRLDYGTSGVMLASRDLETFHTLRTLWKSGVRKTYRALVGGSENTPTSTLTPGRKEVWMRNSPKTNRKMDLSFSPKPTPWRKARSEILRLTLVPTAQRVFTDLELEIHTGERHQIRALLSRLGHPIVGDPIYGGAEHLAPPLSERLWLHAWKIQILEGPEKGLELQAPLPTDWPKRDD